MKADKNLTIQRYYRKMFVKLVFLPLILIFFAGMYLVLRQIDHEQQDKLSIAGKSAADILEREMSDYARELAHFSRTNERVILRELTFYNKASNNDKYKHYRELSDQFHMRLVMQPQIVSVDFLMEDGSSFAFENISIQPAKEWNTYQWYKTAESEPDIVHVSVIDKREFNRPQIIARENLLFFTLGFKDLGVGTTVKAGTIGVLSDGLELIKTSGEWTDNIELYLTDAHGRVLAGSSLAYENTAREISMSEYHGNKLHYAVQSIKRTKWKVIAVSDADVVDGKYQIILLLIAGSTCILFTVLYLFINRLLKNIINPITELSDIMNREAENPQLKKREVYGLYEIRMIKEKYNQMMEMIQRLIRDNIEKEKEKHEEEMKALELQINPHFLSNSLSSIRFMAMIARLEGIQIMTESLINILNVSFRDKGSFHTVEKELFSIQSYINIMLIRYVNNFDVEYDIDDTCLSCRIPKLIMQPFIENAITHGFEQKTDIGRIKITVKKRKGRFYISIWDNGKGIEESEIYSILRKYPDNGEKIGIANINKRLKLYYGENCSINIKSEAGFYTEIYFELPVINGG